MSVIVAPRPGAPSALERAAVLHDDPARDRHPEARAAAVGARGEVRLEDPAKRLGVEPAAGVADGERDAVARSRDIATESRRSVASSIASSALAITFLSTRPSCSASAWIVAGAEPVVDRDGDLHRLDPPGIQARAPARATARGSHGAECGRGRRANCANSSTRTRSEPTSSRIVRVSTSNAWSNASGRQPPRALEVLDRELDRRERVLDLVRQPLRDLLPCGDALGRQPLTLARSASASSI